MFNFCGCNFSEHPSIQLSLGNLIFSLSIRTEKKKRVESVEILQKIDNISKYEGAEIKMRRGHKEKHSTTC